MRRGHTIVFILYILFAIYILNSALSLVSLPEFFTKIDKWILVFSGIFLVIGGINSLRLKRRMGY